MRIKCAQTISEFLTSATSTSFHFGRNPILIGTWHTSDNDLCCVNKNAMRHRKFSSGIRLPALIGLSVCRFIVSRWPVAAIPYEARWCQTPSRSISCTQIYVESPHSHLTQFIEVVLKWFLEMFYKKSLKCPGSEKLDINLFHAIYCNKKRCSMNEYFFSRTIQIHIIIEPRVKWYLILVREKIVFRMLEALL